MVTTESVKIVISADDNASKIFDKVENNASSSFGKIGGFAAGAAKAIAGIGLAAGAAAAVGLTKAIGLASDFEETAAKFETVFQEVSDGSEQVAKDLAKNFGLSGLEAKKLLGDTGDLLTGFGFTGEAALEMSDDVNQLAVDLASFTNAQGGAAAVSHALNSALLGEREALKTYGIAILEADVKAKLLEKGQSKLTGEALRHAKAQATLEIAMSQSKNAIGDFARTQDSFANQSRIAKARLVDLGTSIGTAFLPLATQAITKVSEWVDGFFEMIGGTEGVQNAVDTMTTNIGAAFDIIAPRVEKFIEIGKNVFAGFQQAFENFKPVLDEIMTGLGQFFEENEDFFFNTLQKAGDIAVGVFEVIAGAVTFLKDLWDRDFLGITTKTKLAIATIKYFGSVALEIFSGTIDTVAFLFKNWEFYWESMKLTVFDNTNSMIGTIESFINKAIKAFNSLSSVIGFTMDEVSLGRIDTEINRARVEGLRPEEGESIGNIWKDAGDNIQEAASNYIQDLAEIGKENEQREQTKETRDEEFLKAYREQQGTQVSSNQNITVNATLKDNATINELVRKLGQKERTQLSSLGVVVN